MPLHPQPGGVPSPHARRQNPTPSGDGTTCITHKKTVTARHKDAPRVCTARLHLAVHGQTNALNLSVSPEP